MQPSTKIETSADLDAHSATEKRTFLTFIDNCNITRFKQFHEKSINNKIDGRELASNPYNNTGMHLVRKCYPHKNNVNTRNYR